jgi:hypothetical protein
MAARILQVNFKFSVSRSEYEEAAASLAGAFAEVPGLRWKVWTLNEADNEAGGVYLFDDDASLQDYLAGPLAEQVRTHPAFSDMSVKQFEVVPDATTITRGPV